MDVKLGLKKTYNISLEYPFDQHREQREIEAYKVVIGGFEEFELFVHRPTAIFSEKKWRVSEATTGFAFPRETDGNTRQEAMDNVSNFLAKKGKGKFANAIKKAKATLHNSIPKRRGK